MKNNLWLRVTSLLLVIPAGVFLLVQCATNSTSTRLLEREFASPPVETRPLALWPWLNGFVDTARLVYELREMKDKGMRGAVIWDIGALADPEKMIPKGPAFLGDQSLEYMSLALQTADKLDLDLGMVASSSWNAGGPWVDSADGSQQLLLTSQIVEGPSKKKIILGIPKDRRGEAGKYTLISSVAIPYSDSKTIERAGKNTISLDEFTSGEHLIEWNVPEGKWEVLSFFMCNTGQNLVVPSPNSNGLVIDHLSRQATQNHFDSILVKLEKISSPDHHMKFFMLDSYEVWPMKDWSPRFVQTFKTRYGYDPTPYLPLLLGYSSQDTIIDERFRGDYSRLVSDLMIENHFGQSVDIAEKYGIEMLTEAGHGGYPRVDPLKALGHSHIPMGEFWNRRWFWVTKEAASAAHLYGKKLVAAESLTGWNHWQHGPADFKQLIDIAFCQGLNQVVFHTFTHNPEIAGKPGFVYHAGEHINVNTTWWEMARPFMDYIARCSYMLRQGNFVGDACLYYGDQAPNLVPPERIDPNIVPRYADAHQCMHCGKPKPVYPGDLEGYDFDYMNADILTNVLQVEEDRLVLPSGQSYRVLLLPDRPDISLDVLRSLEKLVYAGAVIIGRKPERSTSLQNYPDCDIEVQSIAAKLWGEADGKSTFSNNYGKGTVYWGKSLQQVLEELNIRPDFVVEGIDNQDRHIDYIHRQTTAEEIYFVSNSSQKQERVTCTFRVNQNWRPELWDPETGLIQRELVYSSSEDGIRLELVLDPLSSRFVVFKEQSGGKNDEDLGVDLQFGHLMAVNGSQTIDLTTDWTVSFDPAMGGPANYSMKALTSWPEVELEGIQYYSGTATYSRAVTVDEDMLSNATEIYLVFQDIQEMARVKINDKDGGIIWTPPYLANITRHLRPGTNNITIQVINTWNNRIVGDLKNPDQTPYTSTNAASKLSEHPLLKSGLIGRAELLFTN